MIAISEVQRHITGNRFLVVGYGIMVGVFGNFIQKTFIENPPSPITPEESYLATTLAVIAGVLVSVGAMLKVTET